MARRASAVGLVVRSAHYSLLVFIVYLTIVFAKHSLRGFANAFPNKSTRSGEILSGLSCTSNALGVSNSAEIESRVSEMSCLGRRRRGPGHDKAASVVSCRLLDKTSWRCLQILKVTYG